MTIEAVKTIVFLNTSKSKEIEVFRLQDGKHEILYVFKSLEDIFKPIVILEKIFKLEIV
jgi:hypothetical protein